MDTKHKVKMLTKLEGQVESLRGELAGPVAKERMAEIASELRGT